MLPPIPAALIAMDVIQADNPIIATMAHQGVKRNEEFLALELTVIWTVKNITINRKLKYFYSDEADRFAWPGSRSI